MLTKLKINKFPRFAPGTTLEFNESFNILLGKNGSGKTSLLNLISAVVRFDFSGFVPSGIGSRLPAIEVDLEYSFKFGEISLECMVKTYTTSVGPRLATYLTSAHDNATFECSSDSKGSTIKFNDKVVFNEPTPFTDAGWFLVSNFFFEPYATFPFKSLFRELKTLHTCERLDEGLDSFLSISNVSLSLIGASGFLMEYRPYGQLFPNREELQSKVPTFALTEKTSWLGLLTELFKMESAELRFDVSEFENEALVTLDSPRVRFFRRGGRDVKGDQLSYGQKRLFAFFWYYYSSTIVIADELVNGFHRDWRGCRVFGVRPSAVS